MLASRTARALALAVALAPTHAVPSPAGGDRTGALAPRDADFRVASLNAGNLLDAADEPGRADEPVLTPQQFETKVAKLGLLIAGPLALPDLVVCSEVESEAVLSALAADVNARTGTTRYVARSLDAADDRGIEVGFLYDARRVSLRSPFDPRLLLTPPGNPGSGTVVGDDRHVRSSRVGPNAGVNLGTAFLADDGGAFEGGRRAPYPDGREPIVGVFEVGGEDVLVIGVHLRSPAGDSAGRRGSEAQRMAQARYVRRLADLFLAGDRARAIPAFDKVIVCGDFNDSRRADGADAVSAIGGAGGPASRVLRDLVDDVPAERRYSYIFQGVARALDHMLVSPTLVAARVRQELVHVNAGRPAALASDATTFLRASDHDPLVAAFRLGARRRADGSRSRLYSRFPAGAWYINTNKGERLERRNRDS